MGQPVARFELDLETTRLLYRVVTEALERWPGGPPQEQETLITIRSGLYAALMDATLDAS
jgi:hypothetical protein